MNPLVLLTLVYLLVLAALAQPLAKALLPIARSAPLPPFEQKTMRLLGANGNEDMGWQRYALALLAFNVLGVVFVYALQRLQGFLPLNPENFGAVAPDLAFNTAVSFVTNTNWQAHGGHITARNGPRDSQWGGACFRITLPLGTPPAPPPDLAGENA